MFYRAGQNSDRQANEGKGKKRTPRFSACRLKRAVLTEIEKKSLAIFTESLPL